MEINRNERTYEGIPAISGIMMALMEETGIRALIDSECAAVDSSDRKLSAGMAVKALIGTMYDRGKTPLYRVDDYHSTAPCDLLFGSGVKNATLSDTTLASRLDTLFMIDGESMLLKSYNLLDAKYDLRSKNLFMDGSNYTVFGLNYAVRQSEFDEMASEQGIDMKDAPMPAYGGNAKNKRNDLLQLNIHTVTDRNGVLMCGKSFDGNTSDIEMNRSTLKFLSENIDVASYILCADCKLCVDDILSSIVSSGLSFITKVPSNFAGLLQNRMICSAACGLMDESDRRPGRMIYESHEEICGTDCRLIAYILPGSKSDSERFIRSRGLKKMVASIKSLKSKKFFCEKDALSAFEDTLSKGLADCYTATPEVYEDERLVALDPDGKHFRVASKDVRVDESRIEDAVMRHSMQVLITNLPFSAEHSTDLKDKASADDVIELYLEQYKSEKGFKLMKSGMGIGNVYIHTPSRISAIAFVVMLATMLSNVVDLLLERARPKGEKKRTAKTLSDKLVRTIIWYNRRKDEMSVTGGDGCTELFFRYFDRLKIDPKLLLGHA